MKIKKTGIALAAALLLAAGCGKDSSAQYDAGAEALEAGNYAEARTQFEACISAGESLAQAYRGAGIACLRQQDYAQAETYLQQGLEELGSGNKSTRRDILFYLAQAQMQQGKIQEAEASYDQILSDGDNAQAYVLKGRLLLHSGDEAKAEDCFERAVKDCTDYDIYIDIFQAYNDVRRNADGTKYLEKALEIEQGTAEDNYQHGRVYYYLRDYENARECLSQAVTDGSREAMLLLGQVYLELDDASSARAMYQNYLTDEERAAEAYNGLALCDLAEGAYDSALENISQGLACRNISDEQKQNLLFNEIAAYEYKMDFATAETKAAAYVEQYPDDERAAREYIFLQNR